MLDFKNPYLIGYSNQITFCKLVLWENLSASLVFFFKLLLMTIFEYTHIIILVFFEQLFLFFEFRVFMFFVFFRTKKIINVFPMFSLFFNKKQFSKIVIKQVLKLRLKPKSAKERKR